MVGRSVRLSDRPPPNRVSDFFALPTFPTLPILLTSTNMTTVSKTSAMHDQDDRAAPNHVCATLENQTIRSIAAYSLTSGSISTTMTALRSLTVFGNFRVFSSPLSHRPTQPLLFYLNPNHLWTSIELTMFCTENLGHFPISMFFIIQAFYFVHHPHPSN